MKPTVEVRLVYTPTAINEAAVASRSQVPWNRVVGNKFTEQTLCRGGALFFEGDEAKCLYGVVDGVMSNYRVLADGRRQISSFSYPGDLIGLGHSTTYHHTCEAVCIARVRGIRKRTLLHDAELQAEVEHRLLEFANAEIADMHEHHLMLSRKTACEKLASFIVMLVRKTGGGQTQTPILYLPMKRADIADYLGLTIETVSRSITKLKIMDVIGLSGPHTNLVHDMERLETICEGGFH